MSADGRQRLEEALSHAERPSAAGSQPKVRPCCFDPSSVAWPVSLRATSWLLPVIALGFNINPRRGPDTSYQPSSISEQRDPRTSVHRRQLPLTWRWLCCLMSAIALHQDEQPSGTTADYADLTARLRKTTLSGGQPLTPGSIAGCASCPLRSRVWMIVGSSHYPDLTLSLCPPVCWSGPVSAQLLISRPPLCCHASRILSTAAFKLPSAWSTSDNACPVTV